MKINALDKDWDVTDITFPQKREIHALNAKVWWNSGLDSDAYYALLDRVQVISGLTEQDFKGLSMADIDTVLQIIFKRYMGLTEKKSGD